MLYQNECRLSMVAKNSGRESAYLWQTRNKVVAIKSCCIQTYWWLADFWLTAHQNRPLPLPPSRIGPMSPVMLSTWPMKPSSRSSARRSMPSSCSMLLVRSYKTTAGWQLILPLCATCCCRGDIKLLSVCMWMSVCKCLNVLRRLWSRFVDNVFIIRLCILFKYHKKYFNSFQSYHLIIS